MLKALISIYRAIISPVLAGLGCRCRFHPSCSSYAMAALQKHPVSVALPKILWRVLRCGPWSSGGFDPA